MFANWDVPFPFLAVAFVTPFVLLVMFGPRELFTGFNSDSDGNGKTTEPRN